MFQNAGIKGGIVVGVYKSARRYSREAFWEKRRRVKRRKDGCSGCDHLIQCNNCICKLLSNMFWQQNTDFCDVERCERFLIKEKGTSEPISLDGSGMPTVFKLEKSLDNSCCVIFSYQDMGGTTPMVPIRRKFVVDCQSLSGIVCLREDDDMVSFY